ncbi:MAG: 2,3-bisphosphoglycerate-independent phosphoglycerate mutase [Gammaproteobacteria bacterium]|nr:2,3-bisphosphoglycerate-independent phosphoglycerate mutase [Gammaproteobacteria bacterium]
MQHRPVMLLVLDGWGYSEETKGNAIKAAHTPNFDNLWKECPHTLLKASGLAVGLPEGQMGNSEVGHLHIGAGRLAPQDLTRINMAVDNGELFLNPVLNDAVDKVVGTDKALHVFGLLSNGGIHSHLRHIQAMMKLAADKGIKKLYMHAFLDGRDTPPKSAAIYIKELEKTFAELDVGKIASISGRFYAMDRDKRWERVEQAYDMLTLGKSEFHVERAIDALSMAYERGETDEFVQPTCIHRGGEKPVIVESGDVVVFMNFRADRGREISHAFTDNDFSGFTRQAKPSLSEYVTLTQYAADLTVNVAFPPLELTNVLGQVVADHNLTQLRIAETEKYAHVTFFLNGGEEKEFKNEDRILVPSPKVATYDLQPEMSVLIVAEKLIAAIKSGKYDAIMGNFANPDMLGHTGVFEATVAALEVVDQVLGRVVKALKDVGGELIVIADHGNAEKMLNSETGQVQTAHTVSPVPFIYVGRDADITHSDGGLIDVAPTMLYLMGLMIPEEMTGKVLVKIRG